MKIRYNESTDTAYIYLLEAGTQVEVDEAEEVAPGVIIDFDRDERPVGIEIYDSAREKLAGLPPDPEAVERIRRDERERTLAELERRMKETMRAVSEVLAEERLPRGAEDRA